jgi:hypothetical protein
MAEETKKTPSVSLMSKKRLEEIKDAIIARYGEEDIDELIEEICEIMKFDRDRKTYTPDKGKKFMEWRKKRAEELGISDNEYRKGIRQK